VFDIASVGHFAIDSIFLREKAAPYVILGGSVAYVSLLARRLDARVAVVSKVGGDFPNAYLWWLGQEGIDLSGVVRIENVQTTRFDLKYVPDFSERTLQLRSKADGITVKDLPANLKARVLHIAPIAGEVTQEVVEELKKRAEVLSLDPQGIVRNFDADGNVTYGILEPRKILELANIYKSSAAEIQAATGLSDVASAVKAVHDCGVEIVIVTLGTKGAMLSVDGASYDVPAFPPEKLVDPTGAGDAFMGGLLAEYVKGEDLLWCACAGSAAASLVVEAVGPTFSGGKEEIYRRGRLLYEKRIKE
jgi:sugar/nucleoside kinase (ribokinase family)